MPGPFPGMDPFLEHPAYFAGLHTRLIVAIAEALQTALPEPYFADVDERLWVETSRRPIEPDVNVIRKRAAKRKRTTNNGGIATVVRSHPIVITVMHDEQREAFVEIRTRQGDSERVVTHLEVLSVSNKSGGRKGRKLYLKKQKEVLGDGGIHLVEIDLLRRGKHTTAIPHEVLLAEAKPFDYHVCVRPFHQVGRFEVYAVELPQRLPEISVPLLPGEGAVPLDLQAVFDRCYDAGPYRRRVHYSLNHLNPKLPPDYLDWVKEVLRDHKRRVNQA